jgi:hypothetical protein
MASEAGEILVVEAAAEAMASREAGEATEDGDASRTSTPSASSLIFFL